MSSVVIRITKDKIKKTNAYLSLTKIQQSLLIKRKNVLQIEHAINVISHKGYNEWEKTTNYSYSNKLIIKDLV